MDPRTPPTPYLTHVLAIARLMEWLRTAHQQHIQGEVNEAHHLTLGPTLSQRFALGFPRKTDDGRPQPFLAVQKTERGWVQPMLWKAAFADSDNLLLHLTTESVASDDIQQPTIPAFSLAVSVSDPQKINLLFNESETPTLEGRELWLDESGNSHVNFRRPLFKIPLRRLQPGEPCPLDDLQQFAGVSLQDQVSLEHQLQMQHTPNMAPRQTMGMSMTPRPF